MKNKKMERELIDEDDELRIREEYEKLMPPLSPAEYKALENSILRNGQLKPIVANPKKTVIDGIHRLKICRAHSIKPKYVTRKFANKLEEMEYIIETNVMRRQLTTFQRIEAALPLIEIEKKLAEKRMKAGKPLKDPDQNFGQGGRTLEIVADRIGVSDETIRQGLWLIENATKAQLDKLRNGEKSISGLYRELKNKEDKRKVTRHADTKRRVISIELEEPPKGAITVKKYGNTDFVNVMLDRKFYRQLEKTAETLETTPDKLIYNAIRLIMKNVGKEKHRS